MSIAALPRPLLVWTLLSLWLLTSLAGLLYFEYQAALQGILCMTP